MSEHYCRDCGEPLDCMELQSPEGLQVDGIPGLPPVQVAHGVGCVLVVMPAPWPPHHTAATVLEVQQTRMLAALLLRQADAAHRLLLEHGED